MPVPPDKAARDILVMSSEHVAQKLPSPSRFEPMSGSTPRERLLAALELYEVGEQMARARLRREHPDFDDAAIETAVVRWRQERPGAPYGDHPGPPSTRTLGDAAP